MNKKMLSLVLCVFMILSLFPAAAFAGEAEDGGIIYEENAPEAEELSIGEDIVPEADPAEAEVPEILSEAPEETEIPEETEASDETETPAAPADGAQLLANNREAELTLKKDVLSWSATQKDFDYFVLSITEHDHYLNPELVRFDYYPEQDLIWIEHISDKISYYQPYTFYDAAKEIVYKKGKYSFNPFSYFQIEPNKNLRYSLHLQAAYTDGDVVHRIIYVYGKDLLNEDVEIEGRVIRGVKYAYVKTDVSYDDINVDVSESLLHYQWQRTPDRDGEWENIPDAVYKTYTVKDSDVGYYIRMVVSAEGYAGEIAGNEIFVRDAIPIDEAHFPDPELRRVLGYDQYDKNDDDILSASEIDAIRDLDLMNYVTITDLTGIEYLNAMETIDLYNTQVKNANFGKSLNLKEIDLSGCEQLHSINVSGCENLEHLDLHDSGDETSGYLSLNSNPNMKYLDLKNSFIKTLDLRGCANLRNTALYGKIRDLNGNDRVPWLPSEDKTSVYTWNECELRIDDYAGSELAVYIVDLDEAHFPDAGFRQFVKAEYGDTDGILSLAESQFPQFNKQYDLYELTSLGGIEYLSRLETLVATEDCDIRSVNLSKNKELTTLDLGGNKNLKVLDLKGSFGLENLTLSGCGLETIDLSGNIRLQKVDIANCGSLTAIAFNWDLDVANQLRILKADGSALETLDVSNHKLLEELYCQSNKLTELSVSANQNLKKLYCYGNDIEVLDITANPYLVKAYQNGAVEEKDILDVPYLKYTDDENGYELRVGRDTKVYSKAEVAQDLTAAAGKKSICVGKTTKITASGAQGSISFSSSDTGVATVSSSGKVTAKKVGKTTITVTAAKTGIYKKTTKKITIKVLPAATTSLKAASKTAGIRLTWKKVRGAAGYRIYRDGKLAKKVTSGSTVTWTDSTRTAKNGKKHTYKLVAYAATGASTLSRSVKITYKKPK